MTALDNSAKIGCDVEALARLLRDRRCVVLSGAGISTESGIPDYRGAGTRRRAANPLLYRAFVKDAVSRRRYWLRSFYGWPQLRAARPNLAHSAVVELETAGRVLGTITQNVDGLHQAAGAKHVIELHGNLSSVRCLECSATESRDSLQQRLKRLNPDWPERHEDAAPDGDSELGDAEALHFVVADCTRCAGPLKPEVVFFGEAVPKDVVRAAYQLLQQGDALLVVGSSLAVFSGFRFVRRASELGFPIGLINLGSSRAESFADCSLRDKAGIVLPRLAKALLESRGCDPAAE